MRQLVGPADRQRLAVPIAGLDSVPRQVTRTTHIESFETIPNQFVRFAFEQWKSLAARVHDLLPDRGADNERGRREARRIEERLHHLLTIPALAEAGRLDHFPNANTVLNSRAAYREIFRSFLLGDVAASVTWEGGDDVFGAGSRDVATLYEYWVFIELARIIESIPGFSFDRSELVTETKGGLSLDLRRGSEVLLSGTGTRRGRSIRLELWFNRTFTPHGRQESSWTVEMRPDCSLRIQPSDEKWDMATWVHFDAKYRIHQYETFFRTDVDDGDAIRSQMSSRAKSDDLRKMHAYRDAIRRTAGAYVLYPGEDDDTREPLTQYHEILPGLGAFVLRPTENGEASVVAGRRLSKFLTQVIDHAAAQGTSRERLRFWEQTSYDEAASRVELDFQPGLESPPSDTIVLLGFVRGEDHLHWIDQQRLYNLRADPDRDGSVTAGSPAVRADVVMLYDEARRLKAAFKTTGALFVRTRAELLASGYPTLSGSGGPDSLYLCMELGEAMDLAETSASLAGAIGDVGLPIVTTWSEVGPYLGY